MVAAINGLATRSHSTLMTITFPWGFGPFFLLFFCVVARVVAAGARHPVGSCLLDEKGQCLARVGVLPPLRLASQGYLPHPTRHLPRLTCPAFGCYAMSC